MKLCPACAETIQDDAIKCPYCREVLDKRAVRALEGPRPLRKYRRRGVYVGLVALPALLFFGYILVRIWWKGARTIDGNPYEYLAKEENEGPSGKYIKAESERPALRPAARSIADFIGRQAGAEAYARIVVPTDGTIHVMLSVDGTESYRRDPASIRAHFLKVAEYAFGTALADDRSYRILLTDNTDEKTLEEAVWKDGKAVLL